MLSLRGFLKVLFFVPLVDPLPTITLQFPLKLLPMQLKTEIFNTSRSFPISQSQLFFLLQLAGLATQRSCSHMRMENNKISQICPVCKCHSSGGREGKSATVFKIYPFFHRGPLSCLESLAHKLSGENV